MFQDALLPGATPGSPGKGSDKDGEEEEPVAACARAHKGVSAATASKTPQHPRSQEIPGR